MKVSSAESARSSLHMHRYASPSSLRVSDPLATLTWFSQPVKAIAQGVAAVVCKQLQGATCEGWVSGGDQRQMNHHKGVMCPPARGATPL